MQYLITEIALCLLLAFLLGCVIGWLLKRVGCARREAQLQGELEQLRSQLDSAAIPTAGAAGAVAAADVPPTTQAPVSAEPSIGSAATAAVAAAAAAAEEPTSFEVEEIEGIGPGYGKRLRAMGIDTTAALLERCGSANAMAAIAEEVGIEQFAVQKWACMADLLRIPGVRGQYSELMVFSGVESVADLASRKSSVLANELATLNEKEHRTEDVPSVETLDQWIAVAASLPEKL